MTNLTIIVAIPGLCLLRPMTRLRFGTSVTVTTVEPRSP